MNGDTSENVRHNQSIVRDTLTPGDDKKDDKNDDSVGFGSRNQFDRASQLRRSKKRKKSRENSVLESSNASRNDSTLTSADKKAAGMNSSGPVLEKSAKDIAIEETVKTLKTAGPQSDSQ